MLEIHERLTDDVCRIYCCNFFVILRSSGMSLKCISGFRCGAFGPIQKRLGTRDWLNWSGARKKGGHINQENNNIRGKKGIYQRDLLQVQTVKGGK